MKMTSGTVTKVEQNLLNVSNKAQTQKKNNTFQVNLHMATQDANAQQNYQLPNQGNDTKCSSIRKNAFSKNDLQKTVQSKAVEHEKVTGEKKEQVENSLQKKTEKLLKKVAEELGVSEEEVQNLLEGMGLQINDLWNSPVLVTVFQEFTGVEDMLLLTTDENLYQSLQVILNEAEQLLSQMEEEYSIPMEDIQKLLEESSDWIENETDVMGNEEIQEDLEEPKVIQGTASEKVQIHEKTETESQNITEHTVVANKELSLEDTDSYSDASQQGNTGNKESASQGSITETRNPNELVFTQNMMQQLEQNLEMVMAKQESLSNFSTSDVMNQLLDSIQLQITPEVTQMELQLHPASLGTVQLNVVYKDGGLTATFQAQNEMVKAAIESQLVQLQESLNEQGLKVESIEVMVGSHAFEEALDQNNNQNHESQETKKQGKRRLRLDGVDGMTEETIESLSSESEMSQSIRSGNSTVEFTA